MCLKPLTPFRDLKKGLLRMQQPLAASFAARFIPKWSS